MIRKFEKGMGSTTIKDPFYWEKVAHRIRKTRKILEQRRERTEESRQAFEQFQEAPPPSKLIKTKR
jgi:hypothetical protein